VASEATLVLECVECGKQSERSARGWRGFLTDGEFEPQEVGTYCPHCARKEFDD
jgi:ribosomal protein L44E